MHLQRTNELETNTAFKAFYSFVENGYKLNKNRSRMRLKRLFHIFSTCMYWICRSADVFIRSDQTQFHSKTNQMTNWFLLGRTISRSKFSSAHRNESLQFHSSDARKKLCSKQTNMTFIERHQWR